MPVASIRANRVRSYAAVASGPLMRKSEANGANPRIRMLRTCQLWRGFAHDHGKRDVLRCWLRIGQGRYQKDCRAEGQTEGHSSELIRDDVHRRSLHVGSVVVW